MPTPVPMAIREQIIRLHGSSHSISSLSRRFEVSRRTIHTFINRFNSDGESGLKPHYKNCGKKRPGADDFVYRAVRCLKSWHPSWGGEKIHAEISLARPELELPSVRTFYRWFSWNEQSRAKTKLPKPERPWAKRLHEGWQIDAKEQITTLDGQPQTWLNIVDEASSTVIDPPVFPPEENL